jgi:hypothetical protein
MLNSFRHGCRAAAAYCNQLKGKTLVPEAVIFLIVISP